MAATTNKALRSTGPVPVPHGAALATCAVPARMAPWLCLFLCLLLRVPGFAESVTNQFMTCTVTIVASPDTDGDDLPDATETWLGTDPAKPDTDNDGMPDGWEVWQGFNPTDGADGALDADSDGADNTHESRAGTNPHDPASVFRLVALDATSQVDSIVLTWNSVTSRLYDVEIATNLCGVFWSGIESNIPGNESERNSWTHAPAGRGDPFFYRIRVKNKK